MSFSYYSFPDKQILSISRAGYKKHTKVTFDEDEHVWVSEHIKKTYQCILFFHDTVHPEWKRSPMETNLGWIAIESAIHEWAKNDSSSIGQPPLSTSFKLKLARSFQVQKGTTRWSPSSYYALVKQCSGGEKSWRIVVQKRPSSFHKEIKMKQNKCQHIAEFIYWMSTPMFSP